MNRITSTAGWVVRGGDQARAEFARQSEAIQELQRQVADLVGRIERADRLDAELRSVHGDLVARISAMSDRLDVLEARSADHDALLESLTRTVAPPVDDAT